MRETPATIDAAFPWIEQTRALVGQDELGGLAEELSPATADLARLIDRATELLPQTDLASKCLRDVVLPDRRPRHQRRVHDRRGELQGVLLRAGRASPARARTSTATACTCASRPAAARRRSRWARDRRAPASCSATTSRCRSATGPCYPGKRPPYKPDVPCYTAEAAGRQRAGRGEVAAERRARATTAQVKSERDKLRREADLAAVRAQAATRSAAQARGGGEGQVRTAIRKHLPDFLAIIGLLVVAAAVVDA